MSPVPAGRHDDRAREKFSETARRRLLTALFDGSLEPGERLHDDDLTAWLGVSRTPVRAALDQLAELGLVEITANTSTRVCVPTARTHRAALDVYGAMHGAIAASVLPTLPGPDVDALCAEAARVAEVAADTPGDDGAVWTLGRLQTMGAITAFMSRRCANPILLSAVAELDLRLAFSFLALGVPLDREAVAVCASGVVRAARRRDARGFASVMEAFLCSCAPAVDGENTLAARARRVREAAEGQAAGPGAPPRSGAAATLSA